MILLSYSDINLILTAGFTLGTLLSFVFITSIVLLTPESEQVID